MSTLSELEEILRRHTAELMGLDPDDMANPETPRASYQAQGAPSVLYGQNACYVYLLPGDNPINRQIDTRYEDIDGESAKRISSYTRVLYAYYTFYGPDAYENAMYLRMNLMEPDKNRTLAQNGLYVVPDIREPMYTPEYFGGQWWPRTTLAVSYNNRVTDERRDAIGYIKAAPIVVVGGAEERTIEVKEGETN